MNSNKLQIKIGKNEENIRYLKMMFISRKNTLKELENIRDRIKNGETKHYNGFLTIDIKIYLVYMKIHLKDNERAIKEVRSKLIIC